MKKGFEKEIGCMQSNIASSSKPLVERIRK